MKRAREHFLASLIAFGSVAVVLPSQAPAAQKESRASKKTSVAATNRRTRQKAVEKKPEKKKKAPELLAVPVEAPAEPARQTTATSAPPPARGPTRIDFDDRLIQGQTNKSGAVYLYDRKELKVRSMIKQRESFRDEIVSAVYDS